MNYLKQHKEISEIDFKQECETSGCKFYKTNSKTKDKTGKQFSIYSQEIIIGKTGKILGVQSIWK